MKHSFGGRNKCSEPGYVFFHVPHDGSLFPAELMSSVCIAHEEFMHYH